MVIDTLSSVLSLQKVEKARVSCCCFYKRNVLAFMMSLGVVNVFSLRNGINVALLAMTKSTGNATDIGNFTRESTCRVTTGVTNGTTQEGEFDWSIQDQTLILASYFYGYLIGNIPSAYLLKRFGIRPVFGINGFVSSVITIFIPVMAKTNFGLLVTARIVMGFFQAATFPTCLHAWSIWAPPAERSRLVSSSFAGMSVGNFLIFPLVGLIVDMLNWESVFYLSGAFGLLWSIAWVVLIRNTPNDHPCISEHEREYIKSRVGRPLERPWPLKSILTSLPVLVIFIAHVSDNWSTYSLTALAPIYISRVQGFDLKSAGILSALPFIVRLLVTTVWGWVSDFIIKRTKARLCVRKISSSLPLAVAGISLCAVAFLGCNTWPVIALLTSSVGVLGMTTSGHCSSYLDVTGSYSGVIFAITNTLISAIGFLAPQVAGALLPDNSLENWRNVFLLAAGISVTGSLTFALFATDKTEKWAQEENSKEEKVENGQPMLEKVPEDQQVSSSTSLEC